MTRRVFLHIGEPKCGTTYLQQILWRNQATLAAQGVVLPGRVQWDFFRAAQDLRGAPQDLDDPATSWKGEWDALVARTRAAEGTVVISHEMFCAADADQAERAVRSLAPAEVHIVLTVRDFGSLLPAEWQETVKHRNINSFIPWLNGLIERSEAGPGRHRWFWRAHDTLAILDRWTRTLPLERVHVITVPPRRPDPDLLWRRFASVIGAAPESVDTRVPHPNESLGVAEVEMLRKLNAALRPHGVPQWFYTARVKDHLAHQTLAHRPRGPRLQLPPRHYGWALARSEEVIAALKESGYDLVGDLDELRPARPSAVRSRPRDVTDAQLFDAALGSLTQLLVDEYRRIESGQLELRRPSPTAGRPPQRRWVYQSVQQLAEKVPGLQGAQLRAAQLVDRRRARRARS